MQNIFKYCGSLCLVIAFIFLSSSCKKYLDKKPNNSYAVPSTLIQLQALLDNHFTLNEMQSPSFGETSADDYFITKQTYLAFDVARQRAYTWNRGDYSLDNDWAKCYLVIYNANYCLEQADKIPVTTLNKDMFNNVRGTALFLRSYNFLNLLWTHSKAYDESSSAQDLGIALRLTADITSPTTRASVEECYKKLIEDAKEATLYLPDMPLHPFRPSKAAAYGLLARAYLSMRQYDSVYKYSDKALQIYSTLMNYNNDEEVNLNASDYSSSFNRFNKETIFYTEMNQSILIYHPYYSYVDTALYAQFAENDLRKSVYFFSQDSYIKFQGSYSGSFYIMFSGIATNELYLMRAESLVRTGRKTDGLNDLNHLLISRWSNSVPYTPITAATDQEALDIVLLERRKELYMRGMRWMDIKRLNKEGRNIVLTRKIDDQIYTLAPNSSYYALPLPSDIIQLTGIPQN